MKINFPRLRPGMTRSSSSRSVCDARINKFGPKKGESTPTVSSFAKKIMEKGFPSPVFDSKTSSTTAGTPDISSPTLPKRDLARLQQPNNSNGDTGIPSVLSMFASPSRGGLKINKNLLQTNVNHVAGPSLFATMAGHKKNNEDANILREKMRAVVTQNGTEKNTKASGVEPVLSTPALAAMKKPRGRMTVMQNPFAIKEVPSAETEESSPKRANSQTKAAGAKSTQFFKNMRNEDTVTAQL